ncbi:MAG: PqqD family protein [Elusimicrobiales bacterium]|nr:PqqD family protein [Elusimicrobiales bacterium]HOJ85426.1 PqqD family protein [Elusimicrobiales bacterium]HPO95495.1 PqqD family protein [Elusimicrobiales bacterium]
MKISDKIIWREIEGEIFIIDPSNEKIHELNETASFVFKSIDKGLDRKKIAEKILSNYDADKRTLEKDLEDLISEFKDKGIIDE